MNSQKKSKQIRHKLQNNYEKIVNKQQYSPVEAIHQILDTKTSIKKINIALVSIGKHDDLSRIIWNNRTDRVKFLDICQELIDYFDEQRDHSMRSTQKNLSQMNNEVNKMRKSLTQKGLIQKTKGNIFQIQDTSRQSEKKDNQNGHQKLQEKLLLGQGQQKLKDAKEKMVKERQKQKEGQDYEQVFEQQNENEDKKSVGQGKQKQKANLQPEREEKTQQLERQKKVSEKAKKLELQENEWKWEQKNDPKQKVQKEGSNMADTLNVSNKMKNEQNQTEKWINNNLSRRPQTSEEQKKSRQDQTQINKKRQTKISSVSRMQNNQALIKSQKGPNKKLETLPQQIDHQLSQEKAKRQKLFNEQKLMGEQKMIGEQKVLAEQKKPKYNPHLEIMKKQVLKKRQQPQPRNQLQGLYYWLQKKLIELFSYYIKELKTNGFTFDSHPQCLDLKTFSVYYKYFKLGEVYKITQIPKYFKKYSTNGTWMNQQNFIQIHSKILQLGQDPIQTINEAVKEKKQFQEKYQISLNELTKSNLPQNQRKIKQKQLSEKKTSVDNKYQQLEQKLKKINDLISEEQLRKVVRKGQKKLKSPETSIESMSYDRDRLKKIVQAHNGINREETAIRLSQKKAQKQKKNEEKISKILEKYKFQNSSSLNSGSSFNKKNNQSAPQLRKIQGYARRNKILRHGMTTPQNLQGLQSPHKQRLNSQQRNKPYLQVRQTNLSKRQSESMEKQKEREKKIQVYKQLSLPKLPKRKLRQLSIYQSLKLIDTKAELQFIKNLLSDKTADERQDERIFNQYNRRQKQIIEKQKSKKSPIQNRMKFS